MAYAVTRHLCLTLSLATLGTSPGWAQQPDTVTLTPIVVTATRVPLARDAVPAAVTVLSGADLRARGLTTVLEALRSVPAAQVVQTGSFGGQTSLFLRGGESDYVKVLLDGVPLNEPGGAFDFAHLTLDNVDRIEIVRGPASVLYGSDAVTGVVQIFTRRGAAGGASQLLGFEAGRYGTLRGRSELSAVTARGAAGATLGGSWLATDGLYPANSGYRNGVVSGRLRLTPDAASDAAVSIRYGDDVFHNPTNCFEQPTDTNKRQSGRGTTVGLDAGRFVTPRFEALSLSMEALQSLLPGRIASLVDLLANGAGAALGALAAPWLHRPRFKARAFALRNAVFLQGRTVDWGLALVGLWLFAQTNPALPLMASWAPEPALHPAPPPFSFVALACAVKWLAAQWLLKPSAALDWASREAVVGTAYGLLFAALGGLAR